MNMASLIVEATGATVGSLTFDGEKITAEGSAVPAVEARRRTGADDATIWKQLAGSSNGYLTFREAQGQTASATGGCILHGVSHEFCRGADGLPIHPGPCRGAKQVLKAVGEKPRAPRARKAQIPPVEPDKVDLARRRQAEIDHFRARADLLAEAAQLIDHEATPQTLASRIRATAVRNDLGSDYDFQPLLDAAAKHDMDGVQIALADLARKLKLQQVGAPGDIVPFNGKEMRHIGSGATRGTLVHVIRPGFRRTLTTTGEDIPVVKADVEQAEPDEIAAWHKTQRAGVQPLSPETARQAGRRAALRSMSDGALAQTFADISRQDQLDEPALRAVIAEMDRREKKPRPRKPAPAERALDTQLEQGRDYRSAAAAVIDRRPGESLDAAVRRYHDEWLDLSYLQAEKATNGHMLSPEGKARGVDPRSLFTGPTATARKYASEELQRWWADNPRLNRTQFRAQLLARPSDMKAVKATKARSNGRDFL